MNDMNHNLHNFNQFYLEKNTFLIFLLLLLERRNFEYNR